MKIQINVPDDVSKNLKIYKVENNLRTQADSVVNILKEKFKRKIK